MVLPFPTDVGMGPDNIIDTREGGRFLRDLDMSARTQYRGMALNSTMFGARPDETLQVFKSGSYTVLLTRNVLMIPGALMSMPDKQRPPVTESFLIGYERRYPGWPIAVCCWRGHLESEPLLWWYEPRAADERLFIPTMDAHDGQPPRPGPVQVDHAILWGNDNGAFVPYFPRKLPSAIQELMPQKMSAARLSGPMSNGDTWASSNVIERVAITS
jgi:hypothetical protein